MDANCDASRGKGALSEVEVTHRFSDAHGRLVSHDWSFECVIRRAQTLAIVQILEALDDEEAVLKKTGWPSERQVLENSRSTGMKGSLQYLIVDVARSSFSSLKIPHSLNFIERRNIRS